MLDLKVHEKKPAQPLGYAGLLMLRGFVFGLGLLFVVSPVSLIAVVVARRGLFPFWLNNDLIVLFGRAFVATLLR